MESFGNLQFYYYLILFTSRFYALRLQFAVFIKEIINFLTGVTFA